MAKNKDLDKILRALEDQGFNVRRTKKGHWLVTKDGQFVTTFASTPSDWRTDKNSLADCKREPFNFEWPPPRK